MRKRRLQFIDGKVVEVENASTRHRNSPAIGAYGEGNPLISQGLGCMKHQVPEMREAVKRHGLSGVDVRNDGSVALTSRGDGGRRGLLKMRGLVDNDGGYGDG